MATKVLSYVHKAQALAQIFKEKGRPDPFTEEQMVVLEACWDNWNWQELADMMKIKFGQNITKDQARKLAKKTVAYLNQFGTYGKYSRNEVPRTIETIRKIK